MRGRGPAPPADIVQAISSLVTKMVAKFRGGGAAAESVWGLSIESVTMVGTILSFTFLGRSLGPDGYGGYAALYAIVGPLVTLAASGVTLSLLQHVGGDREGLEVTARACLTRTPDGPILRVGVYAIPLTDGMFDTIARWA